MVDTKIKTAAAGPATGHPLAGFGYLGTSARRSLLCDLVDLYLLNNATGLDRRPAFHNESRAQIKNSGQWTPE